ncbi:unnamed protein product [Lactuca saligna]|uniref:DDE Tnp4 domain-containing protein n=1 Tax=Lactuca saligna TaxID=75948 RepID=A0AA35ZG75_LACSI|nr:unnamed protein product [Lactuca saligna]
MSSLSDNVYNRTALDSSFQACGISYRHRYYLMDWIDPEHACFMKSLSCPNDRKGLKFKRDQEKARKDVQRAFGALKKRWHILKYLAPYVNKMSEVMYTCIILNNMILEDEGNAICEYKENGIIPLKKSFEVGSEEYLERRDIIHDVETHHVLRRDLTKWDSLLSDYKKVKHSRSKRVSFNSELFKVIEWYVRDYEVGCDTDPDSDPEALPEPVFASFLQSASKTQRSKIIPQKRTIEETPKPKRPIKNEEMRAYQ